MLNADTPGWNRLATNPSADYENRIINQNLQTKNSTIVSKRKIQHSTQVKKNWSKAVFFSYSTLFCMFVLILLQFLLTKGL